MNSKQLGTVFELHPKKFMRKYRILFENKVLKSVTPTKEETPANDTFLEETIGSTIWAIIEAGSDEEARAKSRETGNRITNRPNQRNTA